MNDFKSFVWSDPTSLWKKFLKFFPKKEKNQFFVWHIIKIIFFFFLTLGWATTPPPAQHFCQGHILDKSLFFQRMAYLVARWLADPAIQVQTPTRENNWFWMKRVFTIVIALNIINILYKLKQAIDGLAYINCHQCYKVIQLFSVTCFIASQYNTDCYGINTGVL